MLINKKHDEKRFGRICYIIEAALAYFIAIVVSGAYLARLTNSLGFSDSLTGIMSSFVSTGCIFQLGAIAVFSKFRSVKWPVIISNLVSQAMFAFVYVIPIIPLTSGQKTVLFMVCFCGAYMIMNLSAPQKTDWLMRMVPDNTRGRFTARMEMVSLLGGMLFSYGAGSMIDHLAAKGNERLVFVVSAIAITVLTVMHAMSLFWVKDMPVAKQEHGKTGGVKKLLSDKMFRRIVFSGMIWQIAYNCSYPFYGSYQIKELGFTMTYVSILSIMYSVVRIAFSPALGKFADKKSFSHLAALCYSIAGVGFLVNVFTMPSNGRIVYPIFFALFAISMGGINSSITNLVYDHVQGESRRDAVAINAAVGGLTGFVATCIMSAVVAAIQQNGNMIFGMKIYAAQFASAVAFVITALLVVYMLFAIIRPGKKQAH